MVRKVVTYRNDEISFSDAALADFVEFAADLTMLMTVIIVKPELKDHGDKIISKFIKEKTGKSLLWHRLKTRFEKFESLEKMVVEWYQLKDKSFQPITNADFAIINELLKGLIERAKNEAKKEGY